MPGAEPVLSSSERILILLPDRDSPPKKDFTHVFKPEADRLVRVYKAEGAHAEAVLVPVPTVDPSTLTVASAEKQRGFEQAASAVLAMISAGPWSRIIFLCHGWSTGIQLGFRCKKQKGRDKANMDGFLGALRSAGPRSIVFYACSSGDEPASEKSMPGTGDNSFADLVRDRVGCSVVAHWSVGHATRNPDLIFFEGSDVPLIGGVAWPARGSAAYKNAVKLLTQRRKNAKGQRSGDLPPKGHKRPAFASIPLCNGLVDFQALLSSEPAF